MPEETVVIHKDSKYRMVFERSAVKGQDGFKVEANGDDLQVVKAEALTLYLNAKDQTKVEIKEGE